MLRNPRPPEAWAKVRTNGTNTAGSTRALRIAMPLGMALDILHNAATKHCDKFATSSGVECCLAALKHPDYPVHFLKRPQSQTLSSKVLDLREMFVAQRLRCKAIELPLNYHEKMVRYALHIPSKRNDHGEKLQDANWLQKCKRYLLRWIDLSIMEKTRQMHCAAEMRPPVPQWPEGKSVLHMPIVLWLTVNQKRQRGQKRRAAEAWPH